MEIPLYRPTIKVHGSLVCRWGAPLCALITFVLHLRAQEQTPHSGDQWELALPAGEFEEFTITSFGAPAVNHHLHVNPAITAPHTDRVRLLITGTRMAIGKPQSFTASAPSASQRCFRAFTP